MCDYNKLFKQIARQRSIKAQAEAELERLENEIKQYMKDNEIEDLIGIEHKASYKEVVSNRFDSSAFKSSHADMYEMYKKPTSSMRFTFS